MLNLKTRLKSFFQRKSIPTVIFTSFLLVNTLLLLILGYLTTNKSSTILTNEITVYTSKIMDQAISNLNYNLEDVQTPLILLSNNPLVLRCLKDYQNMSDEDRLMSRKNISEVVANYWLKPLISDIIIIGENKFYLSSYGTQNSLRWDYDFSMQSWYTEALKEDNRFINFGIHSSDYYQSDVKRNDKLTLSIGFPIKLSDGEFLGTVICDLDLYNLNNILKLNTFEKTGTIFLSDKNGKILAHKDSSLVGTDFSLPEKSRILQDRLGSFISKGPGGEMLIMYHTSKITDMKLISVIPLSEINAHAQPLKDNIVKIIIISMIVELIIFFFIVYVLMIPFNKLIHTMDSIKLDSMVVQRRDYTFWELNIIGRKFEELIERISTLIRENYKSKLSLKEAELENLQSQINPHMIYNTLQMLQTEIVCGNIEESNSILLSLSDLFRYSVHKGMEMVPISQEIKYLKNYSNICSKRFEGNLKVFFNISKEVYKYKIPRLLLQPVIENCIIHGFKECPCNGEIAISAKTVEEGILISIKDNGQGMRADKLEKLTAYVNNPSIKDSKVGLRNVNQRIKLKYGENYGLTILSEKGKYTLINLLIAKYEGGSAK
ncbi:MAG: cache domain-containing protein [Clostridia bacterium]|nr:cache domain-containing protein [Clostridia bacterium]